MSTLCLNISVNVCPCADYKPGNSVPGGGVVFFSSLTKRHILLGEAG